MVANARLETKMLPLNIASKTRPEFEVLMERHLKRGEIKIYC